jgi:hypothetical protein
LPNLLLFDGTVSPAECESGRDSLENSLQVSDFLSKNRHKNYFDGKTFALAAPVDDPDCPS